MLKVINVKSIVSVIVMIPHKPFPKLDEPDRFFVVEKPGLDVADMAGYMEDVPDTSSGDEPDAES